ncbi:hypothetical protein PMIN01_06488 [Paraphaeosphaeria minitans]|uniref:Uncharacterized protein n=1 Tax=Paraphaeosphaeria minitans TaxID=565426 RepID=A0A9P6KPU8_9PLEO|nr:hypothetical protein PMIN01_06488 [Paraphaeosphaeria minitans]
MPFWRVSLHFPTSDARECALCRRPIEGAGGGRESWGESGGGRRDVERLEWRNHGGRRCGLGAGRSGEVVFMTWDGQAAIPPRCALGPGCCSLYTGLVVRNQSGLSSEAESLLSSSAFPLHWVRFVEGSLTLRRVASSSSSSGLRKVAHN